MDSTPELEKQLEMQRKQFKSDSNPEWKKAREASKTQERFHYFKLAKHYARHSTEEINQALSNKILEQARTIEAMTADFSRWDGSIKPCREKLENMPKMIVDTMKKHTKNSGIAIFLRAITGLVRRGSMAIMIAEDTTSKTVILILQNQVMNERDEEILPKGSIIAIKQPFLTNINREGTIAGIHVSNPSDITVLPPSDPRVPSTWSEQQRKQSALLWKETGNEWASSQFHLKASWCYTCGIDVVDKVKETFLFTMLLRNCALMKLKRQCFQGAFEDAEYALKYEPDNIKGHLIAARAALHLCKFKEAQQHAEEVLRDEPIHIEAQTMRSDAIQRAVESKAGVYDFDSMVDQAYRHDVEKGALTFDLASFTARVDVRASQGRGKGLFAKVDINRGGLVLCEKAFCMAAHNPRMIPPRYIDKANGSDKYGTYLTLLAEVIQKIYRNPLSGEKYINLFDGSYIGTKVRKFRYQDGAPIVDAHHVATIMHYNSLSCPAVASNPSLDQDGIGYSRWFSTGIWLTAARANHSCLGNANRSHLGDMLILRATRDIKAGEEITFGYIDQTWRNREEINKTLQKTWKFTCDCALCKVEATKMGQKSPERETLWKSILPKLERCDHMVPSDELVAEIECAVKQADKVYEAEARGSLPIQPVARLKHYLAIAYVKRCENAKGWTMGLSALRALGFAITPVQGMALKVNSMNGMFNENCVDLFLLLALCSVGAGWGYLFHDLVKLAREFYNIGAGEDASFEMNYTPQLRILFSEWGPNHLDFAF